MKEKEKTQNAQTPDSQEYLKYLRPHGRRQGAGFTQKSLKNLRTEATTNTAGAILILKRVGLGL